MRLYLVQHGEALAKELDPERPLSEGGRRDVARIADLLGRAGIRVAHLAHSGKTRARQSAELLAAALLEGGEIESRSGIDPKDPIRPVAEEAGRWAEDAMLVGHLPFMGKLTSLLLSGAEQADAVSFRPGSVACLEREAEGRWTLAWMVRPELVAGLPGPDSGPGR
jgi:phosphohistidine phosphatase